MVDRTHMVETRTATIFRHTNDLINATGCSMQTFAARVIEHYHANVPEKQRDVKFMTGGDIFKDAQANAQHLARWMNPVERARMPVDLEESWVAGLGEPFTTECRRDLARRYGLLDVPILDAEGGGDVAALSKVTHELSDVLKAIGPALDDGRFTAADAKQLPLVEREIDELIAAAIGLKNRASRARKAATTRKKR